MECGTAVPLSNPVKPPSRGYALPVDDVCRIMNAEVKGGYAASEGGTKVPLSKVRSKTIKEVTVTSCRWGRLLKLARHVA